MNYKAQPPWDFLLSASRNSLQSFELSRLSHAANLRKEIVQLLDSWLEENTAAMLARWLMEEREHGAAARCAGEQPAADKLSAAASEAHGKPAHAVSDNFFADRPGRTPEFRSRT